jgi:hypothetical protein
MAKKASREELVAAPRRKSSALVYNCDWHADHYSKVIGDDIFGENNFQNEIVR